MKVSKEQIEELFVFTRKHYVEHYDLQLELVDHLAQGIEEQWTNDPKLSFEEALRKEFKKFGVFGFMDVVEKRQRAMSKRYTRIIWKHMKEWFRLPQIILVLSLAAILFLLFKLTFISKLVTIFVIVLFFGSWLVATIGSYLSKKKRSKNPKSRKWMLEDMIGSYGNFYALFMLPYYFLQPFILNDFNPINMHPLLAAAISIVLATMIVLMYVVYYEIPKMAHKYLNEVYPEYRLIETP